MIAYIKLATMEYPRHEGNIRLEHPEITEDQTYPNFPCPPTYAPVDVSNPPAYDPDTQYRTEEKPININGVWTAQWTVNNYTADELVAFENSKKQTMIDFEKQMGIKPRPSNNNSGSKPNAI